MKKCLFTVGCLSLLMVNALAQKAIDANPQLQVVKTKNSNAPKVSKGSAIIIRVKQYVDTMLVSDNGNKLVEQKDLGEGFLNLQEGDNLFTHLPTSVLGKDTIEYKQFVTRIEIVKIFPTLSMVEQQMATIKKANEEEDTINQFLQERELKATKLPNGTYLEKIKEGTGDILGKKVAKLSVRYRGILMSNGVVLHQNMKPGQPMLTYTTDKYEFLPVCEEALRNMKKGEHIRLYIPSLLAFGKRSIPNVLPSYSNLVYEFIVEDIQPISKRKK